MRLAALFAFVTVASVAACSRRDASQPKEDRPPSLPSAIVPALVPSAEVPFGVALDAGIQSLTATAAGATPPIESEPENPVARALTADGAIVVWSEAEGARSRLLAAHESKPGVLVGPVKVLRSTSGKVGAIDVITDVAGDAVIAWASDLGEKKGQLVALVKASLDLARVSPPITIGIVAAQVELEAHVALAKNPRGGVIVAHQGPGVRCNFMGNPDSCVTFEVNAVSSSGLVETLAKGQLDGGPSPEFRLVDIDGRALLVYASSMRGGRTLAAAVVPYTVGDRAPSIDAPVAGGLAQYMPEISRGAAGEIVALCIDGLPDKGACMRPVRGDRDRCLRIAVSGSDGRLVTPKTGDVGVLRVECAEAGPPRFVFAGGSVALASPSTMAADFVPTCASGKAR